MGKVRHAWRAWPARHAAAVLLTVTVAGLIAGGLLHLAGRADAAGAVWFAVGGCGALYALWSMADSLRRHRIGVDVIALLAVAGALAVGELLAAAVIGVMLALLQEAIDVAVILNALRALRPGGRTARLPAGAAELTKRFHDEHEAIRADIDEVRAAAEALGSAEPAVAVEQVRRVHRLLVSEVSPHEEAEERELYPAVDRLLGGTDATATMSRAHAEIAHQIRRLGQLLDDIGAGPPDAVDLADLRALLYGLHAILRLHTAQEDESYLSLGDDTAGAQATAVLA